MIAAADKSTIHMAAQALLSDATRLLGKGAIKEALAIVVALKRTRTPIGGLDLVRAGCFIKMGRGAEARESLREELRGFPQNKEAMLLLQELESHESAKPMVSTDDPEFIEILEVVRPYTMLSVERLYNLYSQARRICEERIPGNFVECGVAAGGSTALLAAVVHRHSTMPRFVWCFDSFSGMPPASEHDRHEGVPADETGWGAGTCAASEQSVREVCAKLGVGHLIRPVKGFFETTLPAQRGWVGMIALLHMDGDWYSSTRAILENLFDQVSDRGVFQVDDFGHWEGCRKACGEFFMARSVSPHLTQIDCTGVWFEKPVTFPVNETISPPLRRSFADLDISNFGVESQMSPNERFQLFWLLATQTRVDAAHKRLTFVEVGSFAGASLLQSYLALKLRNLPVLAYAVEPQGQLQFFDVLRELGEEGRHIARMSEEAAPIVAEECSRTGEWPDVILIDGDHSYEGILRDLRTYFPLLRPGGLIIVHDFLPPLTDENREFILAHHGGKEPGIRHACEEFLKDNIATPIALPLLRPTDPTQSQPWLPIIPAVFSTLRAWRKR